MNSDQLREFVRESNRIEGITREPTIVEILETDAFFMLKRVSIANLEDLVSVYAPGAEIRARKGMDVRVGKYYPPPGGRDIVDLLHDTLQRAHAPGADPFEIHCEYESLHPFIDGNGRSGRALWAWMMQRRGDPLLELGFLHAFYYQTLGARHRR